MGADNDAVGDLLQPPAGGDSFGLAHRIAAVRPRTNDDRIRPPLDLSEAGIVTTVEKRLHYPGDRREIFWEDEQIAVSRQHIVRARRVGIKQIYLRLSRALRCRTRQRFRPAGHAVPDDQ